MIFAILHEFYFFFNGESWTLDDHEIAITLCSLLPENILNETYLNNKHFQTAKIYKEVFEFLQNK